jgi:hypothetical protein
MSARVKDALLAAKEASFTAMRTDQASVSATATCFASTIYQQPWIY